MVRRLLIYLCATAFAVAVTSCSVIRHVPQGSYLLTRNIVHTDKQTHTKERITSQELEKYIRQSPNKRLFGTNFYLWVYTLANPNKDNGWNKMLRRIGEQPVILDTTLASKSASNIKTYMNSRGFFSSIEHYRIDTANRRATVTYTTIQGQPYRIGKINYDFKDKFLESMIMQDSSATLLHVGNVFDINILDMERLRIAESLKDRGYYNFSINNMSYIADSTLNNHTVNLTMVVKQYLSGYNDQGEPIFENSTVYRIKDIFIYPDYDPTTAAIDSQYQNRFDTLEYRGLNIVYKNKPRVRREILRRTISLYPNYLYNAAEVKRTYNNIMRLGYYKSASILFNSVTDSTTKNTITFIGSDDTNNSAATTTESYLACNILCTPALRQSYKIELEASTTSNFYGIKATVGYQNRNLFRGVELFDASITGGYELMRVKGKKTSIEIGGATSLSFPRFILPFKVDKFNRLSNARTKFELSINSQNRPYYNRTLSSATFGYSWNSGRHSNFTLRPIDVSLVKLSYIDNEFLLSLQNPYLINSYSSQLIAGISGGYVYNNQTANTNSNALTFRLNWETTGNLISALTNMFSQRKTDEDYYRLFGIRYSQYFRVDANISNKIVLGANSSLVYRLYGGGGLSYGNSNSIPFDRLFYSGGSNSMRGWLARTLGPGSSPKPTDVIYPSQLGNLKLEANLEARFPIWGILHGAVFFDLGNIWFMKQGDYSSDAVFKFNNFYKQLGFNTGVGARFDMNFFVIRIDWGIKLHDPNLPIGERWIHNFKFANTAFNFGVGYPF